MTQLTKSGFLVIFCPRTAGFGGWKGKLKCRIQILEFRIRGAFFMANQTYPNLTRKLSLHWSGLKQKKRRAAFAWLCAWGKADETILML